MSIMEYNKSPISLREGKIFIDGVECLDGVNCNIKFTPETWSGKTLGEKSSSTRWLGYSISGTITRRRSTPFLKDIIEKYKEELKTPEFTIQGIMNDTASDYYDEYGSETTTVVGCVLTGDITLLNLDSGGDVLNDTITFNAKGIV